MATAYAEWVTNSIQSSSNTCYLMTHSDVPAGMALTHSGDGFVEVLLAGVAKSYQGQGLYKYLLGHITVDSREKESHRVVISTQSGNVHVQKAWARFGLLPALSVQTVHIERK